MLFKLIKSVLMGFFEGLVYYFVYVVAIPRFFSDFLRIPMPHMDPLAVIFIVSVFITLGILSSIVKTPIGIIFEVISTLLALLFLLSIVGAGSIEVELGDMQVKATFEFKPILILIIGFTVLFAIIRIFERITKFEE